MSQALDFLIEDKKQELKSTWLTNIFVRYKIDYNKNSLSEAILRSTQRGKYKKTFSELQNFYIGVANHLEEASNLPAKEIYLKVFQDKNLQDYLERNKIVLKKTDLLKNITFYYEESPEYLFSFFPSEIRNLPDNCNLLKYLSGIDIDLPYNYFKIRFKEKLKYLNIIENVEKLKEEKNDNLCQETKIDIREKKLLNRYLSFSKNLFSDNLKEDYKFYLFLYPKIFKINFIIFIPFKDDIVVQNIIEENENYPYLILFQPFQFDINYFKIELGALIIRRKLNFLLNPKTDKSIITTIKDRYNNRENNQPLINYLKYLNSDKENKYLKEYDIEDEDKVFELLQNIKYYNYNLNK